MDTKNHLLLVRAGIQLVIWDAPGGCFFGSNNLLPDLHPVLSMLMPNGIK